MVPKTLEWCIELKEEKKSLILPKTLEWCTKDKEEEKSLLYLVRVSEKKLKNERVTKR